MVPDWASITGVCSGTEKNLMFWREGGREGGREGEREGGRERGREGGRKGGRGREREGGREGGRGREGAVREFYDDVMADRRR